MKHQTSNPIMKQRGFTIIEVALVLAIAGLIFLVVFLALPALQNSQKDTARKQDVGKVVSALQSYEADNNGVLPNDATNWVAASWISFGGYIGKLGSEVGGVSLAPINGGGNVSDMTTANSGTTINIYPNKFCPGDTRTASSSDASVGVMLSNGTVYCASM